MHDKTFIDYADAIDAAAAGAELNVLSSLTSAYVKHAIMLEECESDYFGLSLIQEGEILDKAKGNGTESMLKRILLFIPRLIKAIYDKLIRSKKTKDIKTLAKTVKTEIENAQGTASGSAKAVSGTDGKVTSSDEDKNTTSKVRDLEVTIKARDPRMIQAGNVIGQQNMLNMYDPSSLEKLFRAIAHIYESKHHQTISNDDRAWLQVIEATASGCAEAFDQYVSKYSQVEPTIWTVNLNAVLPSLDMITASSIPWDEQVKAMAKGQYISLVSSCDVQLNWVQNASNVIKGWAEKDEYKNDEILLKACEGIAAYLQAFGKFVQFCTAEVESSLRQIHAKFGGKETTFKTDGYGE